MADGRSPLRRRVVLFPCPLLGHMNPMFQLGAALHSRGFSITVIHTELNAPQASGRHPHFRFAPPIPDGLTQEIKAGEGLAGTFAALNANVQDSLRDRLSEVVRRGGEEEEDAVACLVADSVMYSGRVSEEFGVPFFLLMTVSAAALLHSFAVPPPLLCSTGDEHQIQAPALLLPLVPQMEKSTLEFVDRAMAGVKASRALIWNTFEGLEADSLATLQQQFQSSQIFPIGPLHELSPNTYSSFCLPQDSTCTEWLDQQEPGSVLYVSFGSMACLDGAELLEIAWGLAASGQPFLWALPPGSADVDLPEGFEDETGDREREGAKVVRWAPQQQVLGHRAVGGFWTHCGWNSVLESISQGVPMLCRPFSGDQVLNASYVTSVWEVGLPLEPGVARGEIEGAVKRLMMVVQGEDTMPMRSMRRRILDLQAEVHCCLRDGGSSKRHLDKLEEFIMLMSPSSEKNEPRRF